MSLYTLAILLLLLACFYTPWNLIQLWQDPRSAARRVRRWPYLVGVSVLLAIVLGYWGVISSGRYTLASSVYGLLYNVLGLAFMVHVYMTMGVVLTSVALLLGARRNRVLARALATLLLAVPIFAVAFGFWNAQSFSVTRFEVKAQGASRVVRFAHIPDVHLGHQRDASYLARIIAAAEKEKVDFILYNGDFFDSNIALNEEVSKVLKNSPVPQYFTSGNHEYYMDRDGSLELLRSAGVSVLSSEVAEIEGLQLVGLEYMNADKESSDPHSVNTLYMDAELPRIQTDRSRPVIVAHHSPVGLEYVVRYGADAYIAGHTHGGQVFPATLLVGGRFPIFKGAASYQGLQVIVSQGAGTFGPWMRLGTQSEVQIITVQ